jgi:hypothetical protein
VLDTVITQAHAKLGRGSSAPFSKVVLTVNGTLLVDNALTLKEDNKLVWDDTVHYECSSSDDGAGVLSNTSSTDDTGMQHYTIHILYLCYILVAHVSHHRFTTC